MGRGVGCGVEGEGGLPLRRYSYGGHRAELWRPSDWLKTTKKQLEVEQSRQTQVYLGFKDTKRGTVSFGPMTGLVGRALNLI